MNFFPSFYLFISLGDLCRFISTAAGATLQDYSCFIALRKTQALKIIRGQCVVAAGLVVPRCVSSSQKVFNGVTGVLERVVRVVCWGGCDGLVAQRLLGSNPVIRLWRGLSIAASGREKCPKVWVGGG